MKQDVKEILNRVMSRMPKCINYVAMCNISYLTEERELSQGIPPFMRSNMRKVVYLIPKVVVPFSQKASIDEVICELESEMDLDVHVCPTHNSMLLVEHWYITRE